MQKCCAVWLSALFVLSLSEAGAQNAPPDIPPDPATVEPAEPVEPVDPDDPKTIEAELDEFRVKLFHAYNSGAHQTMLEKYCHPDIICLWQDGSTSLGHKGVIAEFDKLKKIINKITVNPTGDERLILNNGTVAVSTGDMQDDYVLSSGHPVSLRSRWTATMVRESGRWTLIGFNAGTNAFDNEVIDLYLKATKYKVGAIAGVSGLLLGGIVGFLSRRKKAAAH